VSNSSVSVRSGSPTGSPTCVASTRPSKAVYRRLLSHTAAVAAALYTTAVVRQPIGSLSLATRGGLIPFERRLSSVSSFVVAVPKSRKLSARGCPYSTTVAEQCQLSIRTFMELVASVAATFHALRLNHSLGAVTCSVSLVVTYVMPRPDDVELRLTESDTLIVFFSRYLPAVACLYAVRRPINHFNSHIYKPR